MCEGRLFLWLASLTRHGLLCAQNLPAALLRELVGPAGGGPLAPLANTLGEHLGRRPSLAGPRVAVPAAVSGSVPVSLGAPTLTTALHFNTSAPHYPPHFPSHQYDLLLAYLERPVRGDTSPTAGGPGGPGGLGGSGGPQPDWEHHPLTEVVEFLHQYYVPAIIVIGLVGNLLSCIVFLNTHLRLRSSSYYLAALAVADFGFLAVLVLVWMDSVHGVQMFEKEGWCQVITYVSTVCGFLSVWLIVAFTVERFIAVQYPLHRPHMCTVARAKAIVACIVTFALVAHIYTLKTRGVVRGQDGYDTCDLLEQHRGMMRVINLVDAIVTMVVPTILIIVMNTMITRNLVLFGRRFKQAAVVGVDNTVNSWTDAGGGREVSLRGQGALKGHGLLKGIVVKGCKGKGTSVLASASMPATLETNCCQAPPPDLTLDLAPCLTPGLSPGLSPGAGHVVSGLSPSPRHHGPHLTKQQPLQFATGRTLVSTRTQQNITKMLLLISSVFIVLNLPSHMFRVYLSIAAFTGSNMDMGTSPALLFGQQVAMLLYYTNFSINFLLYSMCGIHFRRCLWQLVRNVGRYFGCGCGSRWSDCQFR
ncbi:hypothetical protein ONE63_006037 [Megalurothrips usitatus]|uniref:G-protein coupled receptors family 1 profile domain-containing protein n=1 Tax=Megalurothrips usitatus TaxID=439358 RepID=A0AAV7XT70_9NEOP|nr:hypothetical protein ONE63_006037 [Megalurothrips usitatus]